MCLYHEFSYHRVDIIFNSEDDIGEIDELIRLKSKTQ